MSEPQKNLWESAKTVIKGEIAPPLFKAFLSETEGALLKDNTLYVKSPNEYTRNLCNNGYAVISLNSVRSINKSITNVVFMVQSEIDQLLEAEKITEDVVEPVITNNLKTFETFVVGKNSQFAHAAASSVADAPSKSYNPLFIYGKSGVGKTHLMQAICARVASVHPTLKVLYVTSEEFTSDFVEAVRFNKDNNYQKKDNFKNKYRSVDMLLIDDIQFIAGKKETQEEFFNTFNTLTQANKQIVLTSDRHPNSIETLEKRIQSRFENGLICDIQPPDYETRLAILQEKSVEMMMDIDYDSLSFIAEYYTSGDVRQLEGVLKKLSFTAQLSNCSIDLQFTHQILGIEEYVPATSSSVSISKIKQVVSNYFNISMLDLESQQRKHTVAFPRHVAIYLTKKLLGWELKKISEEFGGRNHSTIINSLNVVEKALATDPQKKDIIDKVEDMIING
ncbi:MAG: chromosomal replication initiator protein DnaA [Clostridia bacterium]|nr:chromosomal replication initiator protein DnaA [Clostridia bacterium]